MIQYKHTPRQYGQIYLQSAEMEVIQSYEFLMREVREAMKLLGVTKVPRDLRLFYNVHGKMPTSDGDLEHVIYAGWKMTVR